MVLIFVSAHPILDLILGTGGFLGSCIPTHNITREHIRRNNNYYENYEQINIDDRIIINRENSSVTFKKVTHLKKKKQVQFKKKVQKIEFYKQKNNDLWWQENDYQNFKDNELQRRNYVFNLQEMMAAQEESKHLEDMLKKMQEKEINEELNRLKIEREHEKNQ